MQFRKWTAGFRVLPDFIIVGAQKAGTTSLYAYLAEHPGIGRGYKKETHFFDNKRYLRGLRFYRHYFPMRRKGSGMVTGEASPYYMAHPMAMQRIAKDLPGVKLIVMLRDPVERAYSGYNHSIKNGYEDRDMRAAIAAEDSMLAEEVPKLEANADYNSRLHQFHSYRVRGHYAEQLKAIYALFPREDVLIVESSDFFSNSPEVTNGVFDFLGLPHHTLEQYSVRNQGRRGDALPDDLRRELYEYYAPLNEELFELIEQRFDWPGDVS